MPRAKRVKPLVRDPAAVRLAAWVNAQHQGNIAAAATAIGCEYDQLYTAVKGIRARGPGLALLMQVAQHTNTSIEYWIKEDS